jgi:hypothetical protein
MEEKDCDAIAEAFLNVLQTSPHPLMPLSKDRIKCILSPVQIPLEPQSMQFDVSQNTQLGEECRGSNADFSVSRIIANHRTKYNPSWIVRAVRKYHETKFQKAQEQTDKSIERLSDSYIDVIARAARNNPGILGLMSASYHDGAGYLTSGLGILSLDYRSEELDHELWVKIPIIAIPGVLRKIPENTGLIAKIKNRIINKKKIETDVKWNAGVLEVIWDFAREYQIPDEATLQLGRYQYDPFYRLNEQPKAVQ